MLQYVHVYVCTSPKLGYLNCSLIVVELVFFISLSGFVWIVIKFAIIGFPCTPREGVSVRACMLASNPAALREDFVVALLNCANGAPAWYQE